jgi:DNA invertase Pin-like site-specific DNA recombinase
LPLSEEIKENKKTHAAAWNRRINTPSAVQKLKNERCAGRKKKISESSIIYEKILDYHRQKISMREIARYFNVSVGTVHKIINEHKQMLEGANA